MLNKKGAANDKTWIVVFLVSILLLLALGGFLQKNYNLFSITGNEQLTRQTPGTVTAGQTFIVNYTASGASGNWGVSILDNVTGGCMFANGNQLKSVLLSPTTTQSVQVIAPQTVGSCTFLGNYQFGTTAVQNLDTQIVQINAVQPNSQTNYSNPYAVQPNSSYGQTNYSNPYPVCSGAIPSCPGGLNTTLVNGCPVNTCLSYDFWSSTVFPIGNFNVTGTILVIGLAGIFLLFFAMGAKKK